MVTDTASAGVPPTAYTVDLPALLAEHPCLRAVMQIAVHNHCDYQDGNLTEPPIDMDHHRGARAAAVEAATACLQALTSMKKEDADLAVRAHLNSLCGGALSNIPKRGQGGARPRVTLPGDPTHEEPESPEVKP